jgi:hypothetical protein
VHRAFFDALYEKRFDSLSDLSMEIIRYILSYLNITTPTVLASTYGITTTSTQRIIDLCKKTGADTYLSGAGGKDYMDENQFAQNGITLQYQDFPHPVYPQQHGQFEPYLSIIDLLFNCGPQSREILLKGSHHV